MSGYPWDRNTLLAAAWLAAVPLHADEATGAVPDQEGLSCSYRLMRGDELYSRGEKLLPFESLTHGAFKAFRASGVIVEAQGKRLTLDAYATTNTGFQALARWVQVSDDRLLGRSGGPVPLQAKGFSRRINSYERAETFLRSLPPRSFDEILPRSAWTDPITRVELDCRVDAVSGSILP